MKWQLTLQIGINDCPGDKAIDRYCQSEGGREGTGEKEGEMGIKEGKADGETCREWWEMMQPIGKLLPRAIVCCVCVRLLFRPLLTSWPAAREREGMGGFKMTDMAQ